MVTVADITECMEVIDLSASVGPHQVSRIYKLRMKLNGDRLSPSDDYEETLEVWFVRELEDAIQNHLGLLSRINGIKNFVPELQSSASDGTDEDPSSNKQGEDNDEDDDEERGDDLGSDAEKRKKQATDEMDYEDGSDDEINEGESLDGKETGQEENEGEVTEEAEIGALDDNEDDETSEKPDEPAFPSKPSKSHGKKTKVKGKKKVKAVLVRKDYDRSIFISTQGLEFEVHFNFTTEPPILLLQVSVVIEASTLLI